MQRVQELIEAREYEAAVALADRLVEETRGTSNHDSAELADALDAAVGARLKLPDSAREPLTLEYANEAVRLRGAQGSGVRLARSLLQQGWLLRLRGHRQDAVAAWRHALHAVGEGADSSRTVRGKLTYLIADAQCEAGDTNGGFERFDEACALLRAAPASAFEITECLRMYGKRVADALQYDRALQLLREALDLSEASLGTEHEQTARLHYEYARLLHMTGDYDASEKHYDRSLKATAASLGESHPHAASCRLGLSLIAFDRADLSASLDHAEAALAIYNSHSIDVDCDHLPPAEELRSAPFMQYILYTYQRLARVRHAMGEYDRAEDLLSCALSIARGIESRRYEANLLSNLAQVYVDTRRFDAARANYELTLTLVQAFPDAEARIARTKILIGIVDVLQGHPAMGRQRFEEGLQVLDELYDGRADRNAWWRYSYAACLTLLGAHDQAIEQYERAATAMRGFGSERELAIVTNGLAHAFARSGRMDAALDTALYAERIGRDYAKLVAPILAENQALSLEATRDTGLDLAISLASSKSASPIDVARTWDSLVRSRALVLDAVASRSRPLVLAKAPELEALADSLLGARKRLAELALRGANSGQRRSALDEEQRRADSLERQWAKELDRLGVVPAPMEVDHASTIDALPESSALVAFVLYRQFLSGADPIAESTSHLLLNAPASLVLSEAGMPSYAAFVQRQGEASPRVIRLGSAAAVDRLIQGWRGEFDASNALESRYRTTARRVREALWDPIARYLVGTTRIFVVPDGAINVVSFAVLAAEDNAYLIEGGATFHYLSTERDLVHYRAQTPEGVGMLALGGPNFDLAATLPPPFPDSDPLGLNFQARGERPDCIDLQSVTFQPLANAANEARRVAEMWRLHGGPQDARSNGEIVSLTGDAATEEAFKSMAPGRRTLHIATHGFFLDGRCVAPGGTRGINVRLKKKPQTPPYSRVEGPLLRAGLVLAGANTRLRARLAGEEDGILTAEEIASMNLHGVTWTVLSACDTGLGQVTAGEGVLGLRRAFRVAGVRTTIMSLWPVEDEMALRWMEELYSNRFERKLDTPAAVRAASLSLLEERRRQHKSTHPIYWGGFIAAGDWR